MAGSKDLLKWFGTANRLKNANGQGVKLSYYSKKHGGRLSGNFMITVFYTLTNDNSLKIEI